MWVEKRNNGFIACERYKDPYTGKLKKVSVALSVNTAQSRKAATSVLQSRIQKLKLPLPERITLEGLIAAYLKDKAATVKASSYRRDEVVLGCICDILGPATRCCDLTAGYVREKFRSSGKSSCTLNGYIDRYKPLIRWAYNNDYIKSSASADKLRPFPAPGRREKIQDKYLEADELAAVLDAMSVTTWRLLTQFIALSGLRFGEAAALDLEDVDLVNKVIRVRKTYDPITDTCTSAKTLASLRNVHIQPALATVVKAVLKYTREVKFAAGFSDRPYFFITSSGTRIQIAAFNKYFGSVTKKIKGKALTSHALRHTHASLLLAQGVSIDTISRRLGHENSTITREIYLHVTKKLEAADACALDAVTLW